MAAPLGNQFWLLRSKDGRDRAYTDPAILWEVAVNYFQESDKQLIEFQDNKGTKNVNTIKRPRPYSKLSFALFAGVSRWEKITGYKDTSEDFREVIHTIETCIQSQQFDGAAVGLFKENIISRMMGLSDKKDVTLAGASQETFIGQFKDART